MLASSSQIGTWAQTGTSVLVSEECDKDGVNAGCNGGLTDYAFEHLIGKDLYTLNSYIYVSGTFDHANPFQSGTPSGVLTSALAGVGSGNQGDAVLAAAAFLNGPVTITVAATTSLQIIMHGIDC